MQNCISVLQIFLRFLIIDHIYDFDSYIMYEQFKDTILDRDRVDDNRDSLDVFLQNLFDLLRTRKNAYIIAL